MASKFVKVTVEPLLGSMGEAALRLTEQDVTGPRDLYIFIQIETAAYIASLLNLIEPSPRPTTHDLMFSVLEKFGIQIQEVKVTALVDNTFQAIITIKKGEQSENIDCRPSDGIALALKANAPIYVAEELLNLPNPEEP